MTTPVVSEVVATALIVHVAIASERFGPWEPDEQTGLQRRTGALGIRVGEVLKGTLDEPAGAVVQLAATERGTASRRVSDYYGIWAHVSTAPGTELVAFCDGATTDVATQLTDEHCSQLLPADAVLSDLRAALGLQRRHLPAGELLAEAGRLRGECGPPFVRFVWVNVRNAVVSSADRFNELMRIAEDPATRTDAQDAYLLAGYEDATVTMEWPRAQRARLVRAMFRTALDPGGSALRDQLMGTYIPNLVGAQVPDRLSPAEVFGDQAELEQQVRSAGLGGDVGRWLAGEG